MSSGERSAVVSACMQPPNEQRIAELPRRRARTSLHSSSVLERMRTTSPSDRSVCWHATCGEKRRRGEHLHARRPRTDPCARTPPVGRKGVVVSTCMQLRSVCWQATSRLAPCPMEAIQSSAIKGDLTSKLAPLAQWKSFNQAQSSAIKGDLTSKLAPLAQWNAAPMSAVLSVALTCSSGVVSSTPASP